MCGTQVQSLVITLVSFLVITLAEHPCDTVNNCTCTSLYDSDCYCGEKSTLGTKCNCTILKEECWQPHTYADYDVEAECSKGTASPISAVLYTTSQSEEGIRAMKLMKKVMEVAEKWIDFKIIFLLDHVGYWPDITTITDSPEIERDELILCANYIDPTASNFFPYIYCLGLNRTAPIESEHARNCATEHGYSYEELEACVREDGEDLLQKDLIRAIRDIPNPSLVLDRSTMLVLNSSDTTASLLESICYVLAHPTNNYSFPFWIFTFLSCGAISVVLVLWVVRKPTSKILDSLMQLFFESAYAINDDPAELALNRWHESGRDRDRDPLMGDHSLTIHVNAGISESESDL